MLLWKQRKEPPMDHGQLRMVADKFQWVFSEALLNACGTAAKFCRRRRAITPFRLELALTATSASQYVETLADDPCATPPARPAPTGPLLSTFKTKRPIINCLAMAKRLSNASSPFSSPLAFSSNTKRLVAAVDASRAIHLMSASV